MTANTPPIPHTEGMEWTNTETGIKYMFTNGGWRAISSEASQEVADAIDNLDLEKVLNTGNVADKGILLTDATDAFIALNPDEGKITIASDTEKENPRISFTHVDDQLHPNAQFQIELDLSLIHISEPTRP